MQKYEEFLKPPKDFTKNFDERGFFRGRRKEGGLFSRKEEGGSALRVISSPPESGGEPGRAGWSERGLLPLANNGTQERGRRPPRDSLLKKWSRRGSH